jgi:hypothetical protein
MSDIDGPVIAGYFYQELFKDSSVDSCQAAYALHNAVKKLRAQGVSPARWATFIHIGV